MNHAPIRLGVVGLGRAFTLMLPTFLADPRVQLVAAADPRAVAREQFRRDFAGTCLDSVEALARDPAVEALYIASPHQFHAEHTAIAARHGKHVLLEKPMALSLDACDRMVQQSREAGVQLIVGHCHSFNTPYLQARRIVLGGQLGQVQMIQALNYTDFLYRPRRPEELRTDEGGGVVFSQAAHQVDVVRLLAASEVVRVRAVTGAWDPQRPTEGAYSVLLWFANGAFATLSYSGYGHFDSDEWCQWTGEMGHPKDPLAHGAARQRLQAIGGADEEAELKNASTYGGPSYQAPPPGAAPHHQHFGPVLVSCAAGALRPMPDGVWIYGNTRKWLEPLPAPTVPRAEVIDELYGALRHGTPPLHDGVWARATLEVCLAMLRSAALQQDVVLPCA
jgi:phthalate 4,5-cis-dihydrodiol dehydrogenase